MEIRRAEQGDLDACHAIDVLLSEVRPEAEKQGFLISGDPRASYDSYLSLGCFFVAVMDSRIVGYVFALPPGTPHFEAIRQNKAHFQLSNPEIWDTSLLAWIGKIGVHPDFMRQGIGRELYRALLQSCPEWNFLTMVVVEPLLNRAAQRLHEATGFEVAGSLALGNRGELKKVQCEIYLREARAEN